MQNSIIFDSIPTNGIQCLIWCSYCFPNKKHAATLDPASEAHIYFHLLGDLLNSHTSLYKYQIISLFLLIQIV